MGRGEGEGGGSCDHLLLLLSEDVLIQILLCLPVISLLRFKSVCKSWRAIIESPFFINLHLATTEEDSGSIILFEYHEKKGKICILSGEEFEVFEDLGRPPLLDLGEKIEWFKEWEEFLVVGCLNGIICLHDFLTRNVALWNPAIKQSRVLPKPSNPLGNPNSCLNGPAQAIDFVRFGIDIKTNDYKLLLITTFKPYERYEHSEPHEHRIHVYSLSTDSWKCLDNATLSAVHPDPDPDVHINEYDNQGLYLNGSYFFMAYVYIHMPLLLSFDFTEEIFTTIQSPFDKSVHSYFISFGKKVALIDAKEHEFGEHKYYDIWVLNEQNGVKESWTKFYTIGSPIHIIPQAITNNGEFAIIYGWYRQKDCAHEDGKLERLNLITGENKILRFGGEGLCSVIYIYKPSLVPIAGI